MDASAAARDHGTETQLKEPRSQLCRYAFGYSDEKPHWSFWLFIAALVAFVLYNAITPANAIDCQTAKGAGHPWAWRQIDGKRCWYKGRAGMDKTKLRWPKAVTVGARPAKPQRKSQDDELLYSVWPPRDTFDERFRGRR